MAATLDIAAFQAELAATLQRQLKFQLAGALTDAIQEAGIQTARTIQELGRVIAQGLAPGELQQAHTTIGQRAQQAVLNSYAQTVTARKRVPSYRVGGGGGNARYAGGKLKEALSSGQFFEATPEGLRFINVALLDQTARHWARLNAGALGIGSGSRRTFDVRWSNLVVAALGVNMSPSPAFTVPRGYWWDPSTGQPASPGATGTSEFYPLGSGPRSRARKTLTAAGQEGQRISINLQRRRTSRGIEARNFLDAGVARIAADLGPTYDRLYRDLFDKKLVSVRPRVSTYRVTTHRTGASFGRVGWTGG